jgi:hypothetical protein
MTRDKLDNATKRLDAALEQLKATRERYNSIVVEMLKAQLEADNAQNYYDDAHLEYYTNGEGV